MLPPIIVLTVGTSFIPKIGNQTQKIPPKTSVKDNKVRSAPGNRTPLVKSLVVSDSLLIFQLNKSRRTEKRFCVGLLNDEAREEGRTDYIIKGC